MKKPFILLLIAALMLCASMLIAEEEKNPAANKIGKGTDPVHFDDRTLMYTPTPTPTPIVKQSKEDIEAWYYLRETKSIIEKSQINLVRYEKLIRKEMDANLLSMKKLIAAMHTAGLLHDRDKIEYTWAAAVEDADNTLALGEGFIEEFKADRKVMDTYQKKVEKMLRTRQKNVQIPSEAESKLDMNNKEIFFIKKKMDKFENMFANYKMHFDRAIAEKEAKVKTLIGDHEELHKP